MGLVAPWHVGSSQTRPRTRVPCIGRRILNHCATRETLFQEFFIVLWCLLFRESCCLQIESCISVFQFVCLYVFILLCSLARISSRMVNNGGDRGYPGLVPNLRGKAFSISSLTIMLALVGFCLCCFFFQNVKNVPFYS